MNRIRLLLFSMFLVVVTALSSGIGVTYADQNPVDAKKAVEKDPAATKRKADAAVRARAQRDAAVKRRHDTKDYIKKVVEGQQSGTTSAAPDSGGAK
jgi:hypothetical protein